MTAQQGVRYSGRATVVRLNGIVDLVLCDTGELPSGGGVRTCRVANVNVPGLITADLLTGETRGANGVATSRATAADVNLTVAGQTVTADVLEARSRAACVNGQVRRSGGVTITNLAINGQPIVVTGAPNQTIDLGAVRIVINEQRRPNANTIVVTALHVTVRDPLTGAVLQDVIISRAKSDIFCAQASPSPAPAN